MATGIHRNLYPDLFESDKFLALTPGQRLFWIYLFGGKNTLHCGLVQIRFVDWTLKTGLTKPELIESLELFASDEYQWIEYDERYLWIIDFIEDQEGSDNWYIGARKQAAGMAQHTELGQRCAEYYPEEPPRKRRNSGNSGVGTASGRRRDGVGTAKAPQSQSQIQSQELDRGNNHLPARATRPRAKPQAAVVEVDDSLAAVEARLPPNCRPGWEAFKKLASKSQDCGGAEWWQAHTLSQLLAKGLTPEQLEHGLTVAVENGVAHWRYAHTAALKFIPPPKQAQPRTADEQVEYERKREEESAEARAAWIADLTQRLTAAGLEVPKLEAMGGRDLAAIDVSLEERCREAAIKANQTTETVSNEKAS